MTPPDFHMPQGEGCAGDIARYRAIQDNDLAMGHVAKSVYNQIKKEIAAAEALCSAGHEAEARATSSPRASATAIPPTSERRRSAENRR